MPTTTEPGGRTRTVLVVADDPDTVAAAADVLAARGYRVLAACGAPEGLSLAAGDPPDAAVVGLMMAGLSGVDVAARLRAAAPGGRLVLVAVSGWTGSEVRRWAAEGGFQAVLPTPLDPAALLAAIGRCG